METGAALAAADANTSGSSELLRVAQMLGSKFLSSLPHGSAKSLSIDLP